MVGGPPPPAPVAAVLLAASVNLTLRPSCMADHAIGFLCLLFHLASHPRGHPLLPTVSLRPLGVAEWHSLVDGQHTCLSHSSAQGHLGCPHLLAAVVSAAMTQDSGHLLDVLISFPVDLHWAVGLLAGMAIPVLTVWQLHAVSTVTSPPGCSGALPPGPHWHLSF